MPLRTGYVQLFDITVIFSFLVIGMGRARGIYNKVKVTAFVSVSDRQQNDDEFLREAQRLLLGSLPDQKKIKGLRLLRHIADQNAQAGLIDSSSMSSCGTHCGHW